MIFFPKHYSIDSFEDLGVQCVHDIFKDIGEEEWTYNWCFTGTDGVHGHGCSLESLEEWLKFKQDKGIEEFCNQCNSKIPTKETDKIAENCPYKEQCCGDTLTILIVLPRLVALRYGTVKVTLKDLEKIKFYQDQTMKYLMGAYGNPFLSKKEGEE